jgi:thioredoxin 1
VICLCADWCGVCRDYRAVLEGLAENISAFQFAWIDIEDRAALLGDMDIETFPTLLVADAQGILFLGPLTPQAQTLKRLLGSLEDPETNRQAHTAITQSLVDALPAYPQLHIRT